MFLRRWVSLTDGESPTAPVRGDRRLQMLDGAMKRHNYSKDALLEILQTAQEVYGYLDRRLLLYISNALRLPPSHVYGVATFYHLFKLKEPGVHVVTFCMGTACYVRGVEQIITAVERRFNVKCGETSSDRKLSLFITRCIGACAMAPNVIVDDDVIGKATPELVVKRIESLLGGG